MRPTDTGQKCAIVCEWMQEFFACPHRDFLLDKIEEAAASIDGAMMIPFLDAEVFAFMDSVIQHWIAVQ